MDSPDPKTPNSDTPFSSSTSSDYGGWKERIFYPTLLAGLVGGGAGLLSKYRKIHGLANISATYATNLSIVAACYCGAREFVRVSRRSEPDDLMNSAIAGFGTGALLGRLQGGQLGSVRYSLIFTIVGTTVDYATLKLKPTLRSYKESIIEGSSSWMKLPEWSPIQVLDEEALAAKQAREQQLYAQRALGQLNKKDP
ncbi:hypothetical protein IC582_002151 [Cucumis melo]|uniref:Mitochondrial import inner membrane translocase subunit Tim17/Tim22/Tim23 family protein n=2 Tax=Cucumis melo TaxID=3656 RepID=A0A5A7SIX7_CUCMM|nr:uncharacterized protein LOC103497594 [Cucumis melo]KAA0026138.1 mitochondrial import inner membrane translocase subunit Tim17/Tim22/Tim23 family protein [Cucumis melo var. makuwa]TYK11598.1 mitochondrial import inner membrane translocase subunit Tim17/Tim22/Tim23 family protein [Cucumis melo var. makuwa]